MSRRDEQLARMKGLMTYGIGTPAKKTPVNESYEGADGKIYAVIREGSKYYIKSASKGKELVTESFDYIGGFMNKKNNEYSSFNQASKNLELKMRSLNEAYGINKPVELLNPEKKESLMVEMTDSMKASIARYRQIMDNTYSILKESTISASNTGNPEAPKTTGFNPNLGEPFTNKAEATLDKDLKQTANDPEKQGEPFGDNEKAEEYKDAQYVPDGSVANKKPSGGKVVRVNENEEYVESIEECDEWGSCGLPSTPGVGEVGDDAPFTLKEDETDDNIVGFADEESTTEGEEMDDMENVDDVDVDLDDIDDEDELDDIDDEEDLDDIDDEEELDDIDDEESLSSMSEIDELKSEIAELRELVMQLTNKDSDDFEDYESEYEVEMDEPEDDEMNESYIVEGVNKSELPFEVKFNSKELEMEQSSYNLWRKIEALIEEYGTGENDSKYVRNIWARLYEMLEMDHYLRAFMSNKFTDANWWEHIIGKYEGAYEALNTILSKLDVMKAIKSDRETFNTIQDILQNFSDKYDRYTKYAVDNGILDAEEYGFGSENVDEYPADEDESEDFEYESDNYYKDEFDDEEMAEPDDFEDYTNVDPDEMGFDPNDMNESVGKRRLHEDGTKLNVFGKHPGYRKKPMTLPQTGSDEEGNVRDWNDNSVYSEQPFGEKIGTSAPFDKIVNEIVESIKKKL
jgi:hypothetical protein